MLLKHVELSKEDADVIHQSVLEVDETASRDLRSNARRRTCTGSANQSAQKLIADQQHRQWLRAQCKDLLRVSTKGCQNSNSQNAVTGNDCETQGAKWERSNGVCAAVPKLGSNSGGTPLPLTKLKQRPKLQKHMRFIPTRKPGRVKAFIAQMATDVKSDCCEVIHQPMNSAQL